MKIKKTFVLDLIKDNSGKQIIPNEIKKLIQSYLPNPFVIIQKAWRRYKHCTLKMDTIENAYMSIDTICRQLRYIPRPGLVRYSSVTFPYFNQGEHWRCPYKNDLFSKKRVNFLKLAKLLNKERKIAYLYLPRNLQIPIFGIEHEDNNFF